MRDGFVDVDQGVLDAIADIKSELKKSKTVSLTEDASKATLMVDVIGRRIAGSAGAVTVPLGAMAVSLPINSRAIDFVIRTGAYRRDMTSVDQDHDSWRAVAKQVVSDLDIWVKANWSRLRK